MSEELIDQVATPETTDAGTQPDEPHQDAGQPNDAPETDQQDADAEHEQGAKARRSAQARINEITRARHEAEREAAYWRGIAEGTKKPDAPAQPQKVADAKPAVADFQDYDSYIEAVAEWKADQKIREVLRSNDERSEQSKRASEAREVASTWATRQEATRQAIPDYDEVVGSSSVIISPSVSDVLLTSESGPQVAYHLAKNPAIVDRLNAMTPIAAAREIGRLEAALEKPSKKPAVPVPEPATVSRSSRTQTSDPAQMTQEQYRAMRAKQGARWAQR